jgi:hypothetical protein
MTHAEGQALCGVCTPAAVAFMPDLHVVSVLLRLLMHDVIFINSHACNNHVTQEVRGVKAVVVLLVDLLDASGTMLSKVNDVMSI